MKKTFNRPLSPHLTIYSSQYTSIYSIWHRITGIFLILVIVFYISLLKMISYNLFNNIFLYLNPWIQNVLFLNITFIFLFHMLNGLRHILWDLGFILPVQSILISTILVRFTLLFYLFYILLKILS